MTDGTILSLFVGFIVSGYNVFAFVQTLDPLNAFIALLVGMATFVLLVYKIVGRKLDNEQTRLENEKIRKELNKL